MYTLLVAAVAAANLASLAAAQNASTNYRYEVDPNSIDPAARNADCQSQNNVCSQLCSKGMAPGSPYCNTTTLVWTCMCANGPTPDLTEFNGTIPFFECLEYINQCQMNNTQNVQKQQQCLKIKCGGKNATAYAAGMTGSTTSSVTHSKTAAPSTSPAATSASNTGSGGGSSASVALDVGRSYGLGAMVLGGMMMFGLGLGL